MPSNCPKCNAPIPPEAVFCMRCGLNVTIEQSAAPPAETPRATEEATGDTLARLRSALGDRYDVQKELGRGGMATVFLAHDAKHERDVAIKVLHPDLAMSLGGERFEREIKLAAKLQHPHILGLYDSGGSGDLLYYVMPFVKGESVRDRIDREGMLPIEDATRIALEVADALGHAHAQGIIHRDIKPENIMLANGHALVADFGIARAIGEAGSGGQKLTQTGMSVGTPVYMAPEQAAGEPANATADIYSLGCVLYEMLSGEPPFTGSTPMAIMARHLMEQVPSVRIVRNSVPEELENAIFVAMAKQPVDRPQTAAAFAELMGLPLGSTATMRIMGATATRRLPTGQQYTVPVPAPVPGWRRAPVIAGAALVIAAIGGWFAFRPRANSGAAIGPEGRRVAVLYFADRSRDSSLTALADGLTDGLIQSLGNASSFRVISRSGSAQYRGSSLPVDSIARALRAGYLVRGEVEPDGGQVRVSVRLDDAGGANLKRESFVVAAGDELRTRDTLASRVAELIRAELGAEFQIAQLRADAANSQAWLLVQRGAQALSQAERAIGAADSALIESSFEAADSIFVAASQADSKWAEPLVRRAAAAYRRSRIVGRDPARIRPWVDRSVQYATDALALDPNNADALEMRGSARYWGWLSNLDVDAGARDASLMAAMADLERATTLNRNQAGAYASLSHLYYQVPTKTVNDVYIAAQRALDADEFLANANIVLYRLFLSAYDLGQFNPADQYCTDFGRRFPADTRAMRCRLYLLTTPETKPTDVATAWRLADSLVTVAPPHAQELERLTADMLVAAAIARASKANPSLADSARSVATRSAGNASIDATRDLAFTGAFVHSILGDTASALRLLTAYLAANPQRVASLRNDPGWWFRDISATESFRRLVGSAN